MNFFGCLKVELNRLLHSPAAWLVMALTACCPLAGYRFYQPVAMVTRSAQYIGNPVMAGTLGGGLLFALLTLLELDRPHKARADALTDAVRQPAAMDAARVFSLLLAGLLTGAAAALLYLPYTFCKLGGVFSWESYFGCYFIVMTPALLIGILMAACLYHVTRRVELSFVLFAAATAMTMGQYCSGNFLLRWITPVLWMMSDDFGNARVLRVIGYNRLFWLTALAGLWLLSTRFIRQYGRGLWGSAARGMRRAGALVLCAGLLLWGWGLYVNQPFFDHSPLEVVYPDSYEFNEALYARWGYAEVTPNVQRGTVQGRFLCGIENRSGQPQEALFTINPGYKALAAKVNGQPVEFEDLQDDNNREKHIRVFLPAQKDLELELEYGGMPTEWSIIEFAPGSLDVSKDNVFLVNESFAPIPELLYDGEEEPPYTARITLPAAMTPVIGSTAEAQLETQHPDGAKTWLVEGEKGFSFHLYAGNYVCQTLTAAGVDLSFYYNRKHQRIMDECNITGTLAEVFEFMSGRYAPLPFAGEYPLKLVQLTSYMSGGFAGRGLSTMDEGVFSEDGLKDPLKGAAGNEVMAHEIIHQWWGLGAMFDQSDYFGEWSSEGLTVYSTYRMMKEKYGEEYAREHYVDVWQARVDDYDNDFYRRHPEYLELLPQQYQAEVLNATTAVRQYCLMPLKLLRAAQLVGGEDKLDAILSGLFQNRENWENGSMLTYEDFLRACNLTKEELEIA